MNKLTAEAMLYIVSILRLGESQAAQHPRDDDAVDRMVTCLKVRAASAAVKPTITLLKSRVTSDEYKACLIIKHMFGTSSFAREHRGQTATALAVTLNSWPAAASHVCSTPLCSHLPWLLLACCVQATCASYSHLPGLQSTQVAFPTCPCPRDFNYPTRDTSKIRCWQVLAKPDAEVAKVWLEECRHSFAQMIHDKLTRDAEEAKTKVSPACHCSSGSRRAWLLLCAACRPEHTNGPGDGDQDCMFDHERCRCSPAYMLLALGMPFCPGSGSAAQGNL